uniref:Uncharacterized protein isoform X2 n=1 Tax=Pogona vitticeps TaxID=103695 RepID=A0ABM5EZD5_9SAUR
MDGPEVDDVDRKDFIPLIPDEQTKNSLDDSVVLVERSEFPSSENWTNEVVDEECELMVTFCKRAKLMPHARYDCTTFPFVRAKCETRFPIEVNAQTCDECYCYICNTPVVECTYWTTPSLCHCNAHNKSQYWKDLWKFGFTGGLATLSLELAEIDADVKRGGTLLQKFMNDISVEYNQYLMSERVFSDSHECFCHRNLGPGKCDFCALHSPVIYRYTSVSNLVTEFLNQAEKEKPKTEAIALLGAAQEIALHKDPASYSQHVDHEASLIKAVTCLMDRITRRLQRLLIVNDFPMPLKDKLIRVFHLIPFPIHCYGFMESLDFFSWKHDLLTSVLRGHNTNGYRIRKGKKEILCETLPVIEARIERLEAGRHYSELIRYLKVVKCYDFEGLQERRDRIPFYLCKIGEMEEAARALFDTYESSCCTACRLSAFQFEIYLKMFHTGQVPSGRDLENVPPWTWIAPRLKLRSKIIWFLKLIYSSPTLYQNPKCWSAMIRTFSSLPCLKANGQLNSCYMKPPPQDFQDLVFTESGFILNTLTTSPNFFISEILEDYADMNVGFIFAVRAVQQMVLTECRSLSSFLEIILAFGKNFWALELLLESLAKHRKVRSTVLTLICDDLRCGQVEMLKLWGRLGPEYVGELLCLFLTSVYKDVGLVIIRILQANFKQCLWAKYVGEFLQNREKLPNRRLDEVSTFIQLTQMLPETRQPDTSSTVCQPGPASESAPPCS